MITRSQCAKRQKHADGDHLYYTGSRGVEILKSVIFIGANVDHFAESVMCFTNVCPAIRRFIFQDLLEKCSLIVHVDFSKFEDPWMMIKDVYIPRPMVFKHFGLLTICRYIQQGLAFVAPRFLCMTGANQQGRFIFQVNVGQDNEMTRFGLVPGSHLKMETRVVKEGVKWIEVDVRAQLMDWTVYVCRVCGKRPTDYLLLEWTCDDCQVV